MSLDAAEQVANAVLYEGYLLYPYRASAVKNRLRWQFGVVAPRAYAEATGTDPWFAQTECLIESDADAAIDVRVRCLQLHDEAGVERTIDVRGLRLEHLLAVEHVQSFVLPRPTLGRVLPDPEIEAAPIQGLVRASAEKVGSFVKVRVRVENVTEMPLGEESRQDALHAALIGTHTLVVVRGGRFVSLIDPPEQASVAAAACVNLHTWPVLAGDPTLQDTLLSSPIILYDFPAIAPESQGALFDATEIDEILTLRILTLTDEEKSEARATDSRAAEIVNRVESMDATAFDALHGTWRELLNPPGEPPPEQATTEIGGATIARGSRVVVRPRRRADPIDLFIAGRTARVEGVYRDLEGLVLVAVVLDDDPAGALHAEFGRFFYYGPEELEPAT
jgi:hypothetical protein